MAAGERTEKATPKKRDEARRKGQVARSMDLNGATVLLAALLALSAFAPAMVARIGTAARELLALVEREQAKFIDSTVSTNDADYRRSKVLHDAPGVHALFRKRMLELAPRLMAELQIPRFDIGDIEVQVTAHGDGNYFKLHNDSGSPDTATRALTYVYYFYNQPKAFSGGELRIYDTIVKDGFYQCGPHAADIDPKDNSVIFFAPHMHHEVLKVRVPSGEFRDGRFTVNGWVRRKS
jgi:Rps23 Pro-64 3,4-dihydroxylase Tpa1-like proline 4-hydroxylase